MTYTDADGNCCCALHEGDGDNEQREGTPFAEHVDTPGVEYLHPRCHCLHAKKRSYNQLIPSQLVHVTGKRKVNGGRKRMWRNLQKGGNEFF